MADENQIRIINEGAEAWNEWRLNNPKVKINLDGIILNRATLNYVNLSGASLVRAELKETTLIGADLSHANLDSADFYCSLLLHANLSKSNLSASNLYAAYLRHANLDSANLSSANLQSTVLVETSVEQTIFKNCKVYGISAWDLSGSPKDQSNLIITRDEQSKITVDNLQVAQFVYLLLNRENLRSVLDTITAKAVLILGRFSIERKKVLDLIREDLNKKDYVAIIFDFENTENQSLLETVMTLAGLARFIIADVTAATMVREELRSIVEKYPSKPIQPIMLNSEKEYVTLPEIALGFKNILKTYVYQDEQQVVADLVEGVIKPAEAWLVARNMEVLSGGKTTRELELEIKVAALEEKLRASSIK